MPDAEEERGGVGLPQILDEAGLNNFPVLIDEEKDLLTRAAELFHLNYCEYALLGVWNAAVSNLKRRVEAYGVDLWISVVQDESGRKKYDKDGDTLASRWEGVDDLVLVSGATKLGLLNKKAGKSLEMINWMRNHASAAHDTDHSVEPEDVVALTLILQRNLFEAPLPDPGHSVATLFDPIRSSTLTPEHEALLVDEIRALRPEDVRICFGFLVDLIVSDTEPGTTNAQTLFPVVWERSTEDLKKTAGIKYHALKFETDPALLAANRNSRNRLLDLLTQVGGIKYIPDAARAQLYRHAANKLAEAKDSAYGWRDEDAAAKTLVQFGAHVPAVAFEEVYQEIISVWCGNFWGRSACFQLLRPFMDVLQTDQIRQVGRMFVRNERVRAELSQNNPKQRAVELLEHLEGRLTIETQKEELRQVIAEVRRI